MVRNERALSEKLRKDEKGRVKTEAKAKRLKESNAGIQKEVGGDFGDKTAARLEAILPARRLT